MSLEMTVFKQKKVVFDRLPDAGFHYESGIYRYQTSILEGDFEVRVQIDGAGKVTSQVVDVDLDEEYTAVQVHQATGGFVGQVREAYLAVLQGLADRCFEALPFAKAQTNRLAARIAKEWGDPVDYPFAKHVDYASYRIAGKWYALIFPLQLGKLGVLGDKAEQEVEVVNLKVNPADMETLLALPSVFPSYHMSKKNWISIVLDEGLSDEVLWDLVARSRTLANPRPLGNGEGPDFWLIPANPKLFDIDAEFAEHPIVYWTQKGSIQKGDWVCIYVTAPVQAIRYVCRCLAAQIPYTVVSPEEPSEKEWMQVELVETLDSHLFPLDVMKELGVRAVRGPRRMTKELQDALCRQLKR